MITTVLGLQWGDEGKAKVVDLLSEDYSLIVRFQGGANAGHTVFVNGEKFVFHLIPSGIIRKDKIVGISSGVAFDPEAFEREVNFLTSNGIDVEGRILVSPLAHLVLPVHKYLDSARERFHGKKIGTTLKGIGPSYEDRASRNGVRLIDVINGISDETASRIEDLIRERNALLEMYGYTPLNSIEVIMWINEKMSFVSKFVGDVESTVREYVKSGKNVLFEGAQGVMLDRDFGTYPFVTSSRTLAGEVFLSSGIPPSNLNIVGIVKAYTTRVGGGPFPTEENGEIGEMLREKGGEYGATTGRPRRCGWIDLVALKYAIKITGTTEIFLTKLDVLSGFEFVKAAVRYSIDGKETDEFPKSWRELEIAEPIYEEFAGFNGDISAVRNWNDLPDEAKKFVEFLEDNLCVPIKRISVGKERTAVVERD